MGGRNGSWSNVGSSPETSNSRFRDIESINSKNRRKVERKVNKGLVGDKGIEGRKRGRHKGKYVRVCTYAIGSHGKKNVVCLNKQRFCKSISTFDYVECD